MPDRDSSSVQSVNRSLAVLRMLSEQGSMSATHLAQALGLHQSSASRLLRSLERNGFVYKPDFHSFALDYGVLLFAGLAMEHFEEVAASAKTCTELHRETGYGVACTVLRERRLVYLAQIHPGADRPLTLIDNSDFPVYQSSPGLLLAYCRGRAGMTAILSEAIERQRGPHPPPSPEDLFSLVDHSVSKHGFLYIGTPLASNVSSASRVVATKRGEMALTIYSQNRRMGAARAGELLERGVAMLGASTEITEVD